MVFAKDSGMHQNLWKLSFRFRNFFSHGLGSARFSYSLPQEYYWTIHCGTLCLFNLPCSGWFIKVMRCAPNRNWELTFPILLTNALNTEKLIFCCLFHSIQRVSNYSVPLYCGAGSLQVLSNPWVVHMRVVKAKVKTSELRMNRHLNSAYTAPHKPWIRSKPCVFFTSVTSQRQHGQFRGQEKFNDCKYKWREVAEDFLSFRMNLGTLFGAPYSGNGRVLRYNPLQF